jgi:hypothetical protein
VCSKTANSLSPLKTPVERLKQQRNESLRQTKPYRFQIRFRALKPPWMGSIPMNFRHIYLKLLILSERFSAPKPDPVFRGIGGNREYTEYNTLAGYITVWWRPFIRTADYLSKERNDQALQLPAERRSGCNCRVEIILNRPTVWRGSGLLHRTC